MVGIIFNVFAGITFIIGMYFIRIYLKENSDKCEVILKRGAISGDDFDLLGYLYMLAFFRSILNCIGIIVIEPYDDLLEEIEKKFKPYDDLLEKIEESEVEVEKDMIVMNEDEIEIFKNSQSNIEFYRKFSIFAEIALFGLLIMNIING